jgi:DNA-binding CsgD family transcriptional regulator
MLDFQALKWHGRYGALCILLPVIVVFGIVYPIRQNMMEVRIFMFILPVAYFVILIYDSMRSIIGKYRETKDRHLLKEQLLIVMNVAPWIIVPAISVFLNASKQVCDFILNAPFLVSNWIFDKWLDESYVEKERERKRLKAIHFEKEVEGISSLDIADEIKRHIVNLLQKATEMCYGYQDESFDKTCQLLGFSDVERKVMWQLTLGNMTDKEIGKILGIRSHRTIEKRIERMRNKAEVRSRKELLEKFNIYINE